MSDPAVETQPTTTGRRMLSHIVPRKPDGTPEDRALCGHLWDRLNHAGDEVCRPCVEEFERRGIPWRKS